MLRESWGYWIACVLERGSEHLCDSLLVCWKRKKSSVGILVWLGSCSCWGWLTAHPGSQALLKNMTLGINLVPEQSRCNKPQTVFDFIWMLLKDAKKKKQWRFWYFWSLNARARVTSLLAISASCQTNADVKKAAPMCLGTIVLLVHVAWLLPSKTLASD